MPDIPDIAEIHKALGSGTGQPTPAVPATPTPPSSGAVPDMGEIWKQLGGTPQAPAKPPPDWGHALWEGIKQGVGGVYRSAEGAGVKMLTGLAGAGPELSELHDRQMREREEAFKKSPAMQAHPGFARGGEIAGEIAATAPVGLAGGGLPTLARAGAAGLQGAAAAGLLSPGDWAQRGKQAAIAGPLSLVPGLAGAAIGPRIDPAFQAIRQAYPDLAQMVTGTLGRTKEAFQTATANFALRPIDEALTRGTKVGKEMLDQVEDKISAAYDVVVPHLTFNAHAPNPQTGISFASGLASLRDQLPTAYEKDFDKVISQQITSKLDANGNLTGQWWKQADSNIGRMANDNLKGNATAGEKAFGKVLRELQELSRETLASQNGNLAPALQKVDQAWSRFAQMKYAAGRTLTDLDEFSPNDLLYAARGNIGVPRFAQSESEMKAFGRAGSDLLNGRQPAWRKYFPQELGATMGATAGGYVGHRLAGPYGAMVGTGVGGAAGAGAGGIAARMRLHPTARAVGRAVQTGGVGAAANVPESEPYVGPSGL